MVDMRFKRARALLLTERTTPSRGVLTDLHTAPPPPVMAMIDLTPPLLIGDDDRARPQPLINGTNPLTARYH